MEGLATSVIEVILIAIAIDFQPFQTLPLIINRHAGHYTAWFKFSALLRKQVRADCEIGRLGPTSKDLNTLKCHSRPQVQKHQTPPLECCCHGFTTDLYIICVQV